MLGASHPTTQQSWSKKRKVCNREKDKSLEAENGIIQGRKAGQKYAKISPLIHKQDKSPYIYLGARWRAPKSKKKKQKQKPKPTANICYLKYKNIDFFDSLIDRIMFKSNKVYFLLHIDHFFLASFVSFFYISEVYDVHMSQRTN